MASTTSHLFQTLSIPTLSSKPRVHMPPAPLPPLRFSSRRQLLLLLTATTALKAAELPARAEDIGLFGLRKKLKKAEEEAEVIVKEGFESAEKGIEAAEKGIKAVEKGIESAEKGIEKAENDIETAVSFSGLAQAGVVAGAELVGVFVATSVVNGILGPEGQKA